LFTPLAPKHKIPAVQVLLHGHIHASVKSHNKSELSDTLADLKLGRVIYGRGRHNSNEDFKHVKASSSLADILSAVRSLERVETSEPLRHGAASAIRAERLIRFIEEALSERISFREQAEGLKRLASDSEEVRIVLWKILNQEAHPHLRWVAMEILAAHEWQKLVPLLVTWLHNWDVATEREAWLGAVLTIRKCRVPDELRASVADALRNRLVQSQSDTRALAGHQPDQTEVVCEAIDTFRSFAEPGDLALLSRFWQPDCTFTVQLRALEAATLIVRRFPENADTDVFMAKECPALAHRLSHLALERMVAVENGTLLWSVAGLLAARMGDEAAAILLTAGKHRSLIRRLRSLLRDSEDGLARNGHSEWLARRTGVLVSQLDDIEKAEK
jgi:hypothetical protein